MACCTVLEKPRDTRIQMFVKIQKLGPFIIKSYVNYISEVLWDTVI